MYEWYKITVDPGQKPVRIDSFVADHIEGLTRSQVQKAAKENGLVVNGQVVKANYKVRPGDEITVMYSRPKYDWVLTPENIPINIVYEDDHLVVVNKEAGMVVHPANGHYSGTLVNALAYHLKNAPIFHEDNIRGGLVHRIDKDTSGLLVVAKTLEAQQHLAKQFAAHSTKRTYIALVWGDFDHDEGTVRGHIGRHPKRRQSMYVFEDGSHGKHAVTHYKVLKRFHFVTLLQLNLETGRTHQIRAHMRHIGHPLFGDAEYGGDKILRGIKTKHYMQFVDNCLKILPRQALHAKSLGFVHPATGEEMFFDSELPEDMKTVIEKWENYTKDLVL